MRTILLVCCLTSMSWIVPTMGQDECHGNVKLFGEGMIKQRTNLLKKLSIQFPFSDIWIKEFVEITEKNNDWPLPDSASTSLPTPTQLCTALFPECEQGNQLINQQVSNMTLPEILQCFECSVCKFGLIWAQFEEFLNDSTKDKWQVEADAWCEVNFYDNKHVVMCENFLASVISEVLKALHVVLDPEAFCDRNFCKDSNAQANVLLCVRDLCEYLFEHVGSLQPFEYMCKKLPY